MFNTLVSWLPTADTLPWGLDDIWTDAIAYFKGFTELFPPMEIVFQAFMIYLGFRLLLIVVKIFVGSRVPHHD